MTSDSQSPGRHLERTDHTAAGLPPYLEATRGVVPCGRSWGKRKQFVALVFLVKELQPGPQTLVSSEHTHWTSYGPQAVFPSKPPKLGDTSTVSSVGMSLPVSLLYLPRTLTFLLRHMCDVAGSGDLPGRGRGLQHRGVGAAGPIAAD